MSNDDAGKRVCALPAMVGRDASSPEMIGGYFDDDDNGRICSFSSWSGNENDTFELFFQV
jgi:hypothetical protein